MESRSLSTYALLAAATWIVYHVAVGIYRAYLGPLAKIPGPKLYAASPFPWLRYWIQGTAPRRLEELHKQYGPVVRFSPDEISFISAEAWQDIYGHHRSRVFVKSRKQYNLPPEGVDSILTDIDADSHARQRRLLSHSFSEKALQEQETLMKTYIDLLIEKLRSKSGEVVNMVKWYNYTTFDLIGDLTFGDPFDCLKEGSFHPWVAMIFDAIRAVSLLSVVARFPSLHTVLMKMIPKRFLERRAYHVQLGKEKMLSRLAETTDRKDFFSYILRQKDQRSMPINELAQNSTLLIIAGSETTATLLCGATYLLLKNRDKLAKLQQEVRSAFKEESEITLVNTGHLKYLHAVLEESLRIYPPVPIMLPRIATQDSLIDGYAIPKGFAAYHSPLNFHEPEAFRPERWIDSDPRDKKAVLLPFSLGPRNCIGRNLAYAEMRLILSRMVWNFEMSLDVDNWNIREQHVHLLWQKPDLMVQLKKRELL